MPSTFKIHPAIGIARLGNYRPADEPDADFFITPESPGGLPIKCDGKTGLPHTSKDGKEATIDTFKKNGQIVRQAARFRVYSYDDDGTATEVSIGDRVTVLREVFGQTIVGTVTDVTWTVYVANKKAIWYEFQELAGEHGYAPDHPLRNATITDEDARRQMIIDPGQQTVGTPTAKAAQATRASFARGANGNAPQSFPPALNPNSIDTLGELYGTRDSADHSRLLVLGGFGNSGSATSGLGEPKTTSFANNDGWFDDIADGPVNATLTIEIETVDGEPPVGSPTMTIDAAGAWVVTAYPAYLPEIENIIRLDEAIYDVAVREQAYDTHLYGVPPFDGNHEPRTPQELRVWRENAYFNPDYYPYFWRDIWPILRRPQYLIYLLVFDPLLGAAPHQTDDPRENFYPGPLSVPPYEGEDPAERETNRERRFNIYDALRKPGQQNQYQVTPDPGNPDYLLRGMPELCGDNPITNTLPQKFLILTRTMLFLLKQWANGKFINECEEHLVPDCEKDGRPPISYWCHEPTTPTELDQGVLSNGLGGAFCPGGEVTWIVRNPAIYSEPFRINQSRSFTPGSLTLTPAPATGPVDPEGNFTATVPGGISDGLEPGDITKYNAVPWQTDFNECSTQQIDITYEEYNKTYPASTGDPFPQSIQTVWWWPTHRPLWVMEKNGTQVEWTRGIPQADTGDMMMVRAWSGLGFVVQKSTDAGPNVPQFYEFERNDPLIPDDGSEGGG